VDISAFRESEFMTLTRSEQRETVQQLMEQAHRAEQKAMLVSSISVLQGMLSDPRSETRVKEILARGDVLALVQDVPLEEVPEILLVPRGIERFEVQNINQLLSETPKFQQIARKWPFAIMKEGYQSDRYVVLTEQPVSLILYRIIALNPNLYQAAKNPEFLKLLQDLVTEALAQEASRKAA